MTDTITPFAAAIARAEQTHAERAQAAAEAQAETDALRGRAAAVASRRAEIKADLGADKLDARSAGGLLAVCDDDGRDLSVLIAEAEARQTAAETAQAKAQADLDRAREQLSRAEAGERFGMLTKRAAELDKLLCDCVATMAAVGREAGRGRDLASLWTPSKRLSQAIQLRVVPAPEQAA